MNQNKMQNRTNLLIEGVQRIVIFYLLFLFLMILFRCFFVFYFGENEIFNTYQSDLLYSFFMGWKYDSLILSYFIAPFFLLLIFISIFNKVFLFNVWQFCFFQYSKIVTILLVVILISDLAFFSYFQDHINILFFGTLEDDTFALIETVWKNYPVTSILLGFLVYYFGFTYILRKNFQKVLKSNIRFSASSLKYFTLLIISFVLLLGGLRGGYGKFVLAPKYSDFSRNSFINLIPINGVVALEKTIKLRQSRNSDDYNILNAMGYDNDIYAAFNDYIGIDTRPTQKEQLLSLIKRFTPENQFLEKNKPNVIVFLMESFGGSWLKYQSSDFDFMYGLEDHFKNDFYFPNFLSSDNGTIGSLMSLESNIPNRPGTRYLSESKYMRTPLTSSAHEPYKTRGYETSFLYGGKLAWRDIGNYFKHQGYHRLIGEAEIIDSLGLEGENGSEWGLYDEHLFNFVIQDLEKSKTPKFMLALSTSNHPPFEVPKNFEFKSLKIPAELESRITREKDLFQKRFQAFQYANAKLKEFIEKIKNSSLGENTIIAVTGDHNFWGFMNYKKSEGFLKHTVPFYLYIPKKYQIEKIDMNRLGSHEDIFPTLYNLSLSNTEYISFGEDLFSKNQSFAINNDVSAGEEGVVIKGKCFKWDKIPLIEEEEDERCEFPLLLKRYRSTLSIADFYLNQMHSALKTYQ